MHVILLTCKVHMYHTLNHSLFRATHEIVYVFCSALLRRLVRMQGLQDLSTLSKSLFHVTDNYSTVNYPYDFRNRALSCVKLVLWTCSRGVSNRSMVTVEIWKAKVDCRWGVGVCSFPLKRSCTLHFEKNLPSPPFLLMLDVF